MYTSPFEAAERAEQHADAEQQAALDIMRARLMNAGGKRPMVPLPFGKQQPLDKYVGLRTLPFIKNPFVSDPSVLLENPDPSAHYGLAKRDDAGTRGKIRSGKYEDVYYNELKGFDPTTGKCSLEADISVEDVLTEKGPNKLVIWHGLQLVKIPAKTWLTEVEEPALMSAARLALHTESFRDLSFRPVTTGHYTDEKGGQISSHVSGGGSGYRDMRDSVQITETSMEA